LRYFVPTAGSVGGPVNCQPLRPRIPIRRNMVATFAFGPISVRWTPDSGFVLDGVTGLIFT